MTGASLDPPVALNIADSERQQDRMHAFFLCLVDEFSQIPAIGMDRLLGAIRKRTVQRLLADAGQRAEGSVFVRGAAVVVAELDQ